MRERLDLRNISKIKNKQGTYHCPGTLGIMDVGTDISAGSTSNHHVAALLHLYSIVVEMHDSGLLRKNIDMAAEGDDVVAAGDGGEDARLDVHCSISSRDGKRCRYCGYICVFFSFLALYGKKL